MGRMVIMVFILIGSAIIFIVKSAAKKVTGGKDVSFKDETRKVMDKTAKGVGWMNEQWDEAKRKAQDDNKDLNP